MSLIGSFNNNKLSVESADKGGKSAAAGFINRRVKNEICKNVYRKRIT